MNIIPTVLEKDSNKEVAYDLYSRMLEDRIIFLCGEINDDMAAANFRSDANDSNVQGTFDLANMLFNEIIMQKKIGIN